MGRDLHRKIIRGMWIGGLVAGAAGGLVAAVNVYLGHFDPLIYPYRNVFTVSIFFVGGFIFALLPGIVSGLLISLAVFYLRRYRSDKSDWEIIQSQEVWPPAPAIKKINDHDDQA